MGRQPGRDFLAATLLASALTLGACGHHAPEPPASVALPLPLIPMPAEVAPATGHFTVDAGTPVLVPADDPQSEQIADFLVDHVHQVRGLALPVRKAAPDPAGKAIALVLAPSAAAQGPEGYRIDISDSGITIAAASHSGLFYGAVTLWQLLTADDANRAQIDVPDLHIVDQPRFAWRGLLLDVARHYQPPASIRQLVDWMLLHKLNVLHWHLTDDQGWRLQIRKYPRLTDVGAWRRPPGGTGARPVGGFYTQDEVRDLVRYAQSRYVTIVPEIDMPGHAQAAIAAYPALGCLGDRPVVSSSWGVHDYLLNVDEPTFDFVADVLDEVTRLFPGPYIHVGGDEAIKNQWKASPEVQKRMHELGIKDENALQGYFMQRVAAMLAVHGRKLVGWDEIVEAGLPADATVMSWRGADGALTAAGAGHDVIMSPSDQLYFDHIQSNAHDEPPGRPPPITLQDVLDFDPLPKGLSPDAVRHIIGVQANVWGEYMPTPERVQHAVFPRVAALAEVAWSPAQPRQWPDFLHRLVPMLARYRALGIAYADSAFEVRVDARPEGEGAVVALSNQAAQGDIRYTLDGSVPGIHSARFEHPLQLALPIDLQAATFIGETAVSTATDDPLSRPRLLTRNSDELATCASKLPLRLGGEADASGDPAVYRVDIMDPCWIYQAAPMDHVDAIGVRLARLPYNFSLGADASGVVLRPPKTPHGEIEIHEDHCDGPLLATQPLTSAQADAAGATLSVPVASVIGAHDLCVFVTAKALDPLWVVDAVWLTEGRSGTRASVGNRHSAAFQTARRVQ